MREEAKQQHTHVRRGICRGYDVPFFVCGFPQRREHFRRMLEVPFNKTVDLFLDIGASRFRRVRYPNVSELINVKVPDLGVPVPPYQQTVILSDLSHSPRCESAE